MPEVLLKEFEPPQEPLAEAEARREYESRGVVWFSSGVVGRSHYQMDRRYFSSFEAALAEWRVGRVDVVLHNGERDRCGEGPLFFRCILKDPAREPDLPPMWPYERAALSKAAEARQNEVDDFGLVGTVASPVDQMELW